MEISERLKSLPPYLFVEISRKIAEKKASGVDVISLAIGDPDLPTPSHIIESLKRAAEDPANHRYPETEGLPELREAIAEWYERRFGVKLDPKKEVLPLIGAKEGIAHLPLCFLNPGDIALVPDPGYPPYTMGTLLAGGEPYFIPLLEENDFLPDFEKIPEQVASKAKVLWLNYPNNPTGAVANLEFFERAVFFARKHEILLCHDAAYSEISLEEGYRAPSLLQVPGAKEVGIEFHSFSKSYNMCGWRMGMVVGEGRAVEALMRLKSNLDSGIPQAIQLAAIAALRGPQECIEEHCRIYRRRRDRILETLGKIGLKAKAPKAGLYIWARVPEGLSSLDFATSLLEETGVVVTPGSGYGRSGEGYIRISLTVPDERLDEALRRIESWAGRRAGI